MLAPFAAACASAGCERPRTDTVVLPLVAGEYYLFHPEGAERRRGTEILERLAEPPPTAGALDREEAYAAAAFGNRVVFLEEGRRGGELLRPPQTTSWTIDAMALRGGLAALTSVATGDVRVVRVPSGEIVWEGRPAIAVPCLHYAVPFGDDKVLLIGEDAGGVVAEEVSRAHGAFESNGIWRSPALRRVRACATAGKDVIIAGMWEEARPPSMTSPRPGTLRVRLEALRFVPDTGRFHEVASEESYETFLDVRQAVAGDRYFALVLALPQGRYQVRAYDLAPVGRARELLSVTYDGPVSVAWYGPDQVAIFQPGAKPDIRQLAGAAPGN